MASSLRDVVIDCERAPALARFWAAALDGDDIRPYDEAEIERLAATGADPRHRSDRVRRRPRAQPVFPAGPEKKAATNRVLLGFVSEDRPAEVERLVGLSVIAMRELDRRTLMGDPEGNEFCVTDAH